MTFMCAKDVILKIYSSLVLLELSYDHDVIIHFPLRF